MAEINLQRALRVPVIPGRSALSGILHDIERGNDKWGDFALVATLGSLGLPDVGYIAVPVEISGLEERLEPRHEIRFRMRSKRSPEAFPEFEGGCGIDSNGPSASILWMTGTYEVPLRGLGAILDKTIARGMAEKTLDNMIDVLADAVAARVESREINESRYRLFYKSGE